MKNGQLKAGYNMQIGVESEYIAGVGAFSNRTDVQTLIPFLDRMKCHTQRKIEQVVADAGYESKENYLYLKENGQKSFIKPQNYEISKTRKYKADPYRAENMTYDKENDSYLVRTEMFCIFHTARRNGPRQDMRWNRNTTATRAVRVVRITESATGQQEDSGRSR